MTRLAEAPAADAVVAALDVHAFRIPVDGPGGVESDGTLEWDATTIVVVEAHGEGKTGLGYTYGHEAAALLADERLRPAVEGADALDVAAVWQRLAAGLRNVGRPGIGFSALAAVDVALWDLKAKLLGIPLVTALDAYRERAPIYGSGGFCNYEPARLAAQLGGWVEQGIPRVKLKTSRRPGDDPERLRTAREAIGDSTELYVDANGALSRTQALDWAERFRSEWGVSWFEEPVSSADAAGLRLLRDRGPAGLDVAAGKYGFVLEDFAGIVDCVDCLQVDVTRCGGITPLRAIAGLAEAHGLDVSAHGAPQVSAHAFCAVRRLRHLEYFHDHVRVERLVFDGVLEPTADGMLAPDRSRPGLGLELRHGDVERFRVYGRAR